MKNIKMIQNTKTTKALNAQKQIGPLGFPFTCNPVIGCGFACKYCFSRLSLRKSAEDFFLTTEVKMNLPMVLDKELEKYSHLPQHLKRVQINEACDVYHPAVMQFMKTNNIDVMKKSLEIFKKHKDKGNKWMLHILTKSHLILQHLSTLKDLKDMVQVEISISSIDDTKIRQMEMYTPSIKRRLETIHKLSNEGIFVRVMAMPFYGTDKELLDLKNLTFENGAQAFKHKELNYFDWNDVASTSFDEVLAEKLIRSGIKRDAYNPDFIIKSGEYCYDENGQQIFTDVNMPRVRARGEQYYDWSVVSKMNERLVPTKIPVIDCGYSIINKENWNYIK